MNLNETTLQKLEVLKDFDPELFKFFKDLAEEFCKLIEARNFFATYYDIKEFKSGNLHLTVKPEYRKLIKLEKPNETFRSKEDGK